MKKRTPKAGDWLKVFLDRRGISEPDGRHLFSYRATTDECFALRDILCEKVEAAARIMTDVLKYWEDNESFCALFVLHASCWWQQHGTRFEWKPIMDSLDFPGDSWKSADMRPVIVRGLGVWKLSPAENGYRYVGAIAREAGLPQKLLAESRGAIGDILRRVLREALKSHPSDDVIRSWIGNMRDMLPLSCRDGIILDLLADSVIAILETRKLIHAADPDAALADLDAEHPHWRERFPLPLHDAGARRLLEQLVREAAGGRGEDAAGRGHAMFARRRLHEVEPGAWKLTADVVLEDPISILGDPGGRQDSLLASGWPPLLALRAEAGSSACDNVVLRRRGQDSVYLCRGDSPSFSGRDAAAGIGLHVRTQTGEELSVACAGGEELDAELPWVFEGDEPMCLRRQGGGSVRSIAMLLALAPGCSVVPDDGCGLEHAGQLDDVGRDVWRLRGTGVIRGADGQEFRVRSALLEEESSFFWKGRRLWDADVRPPAFLGLPVPVRRLSDGRMEEIRDAESRWRPSGASGFRSDTSGARGVGVLWSRDPRTDGHMRGRMVVLPPDARVVLRADGGRSGKVSLEGWGADEAAAVDAGAVICRMDRRGDSLDLDLEAHDGRPVPEHVEIRILWKDAPDAAILRIPFPACGARLFDAQEREIPNGGSLCLADLFGKRILCMPAPGRVPHPEARFSVDGREISFALNPAGSGMFRIHPADWQPVFAEMLAGTSNLDASVEMAIFFNGSRMAGWRVFRYGRQFICGNGEIIPADSSGRPLAGMAAGRMAEARMRATCLTSPEAGVRELAPILEEGGPTGRWQVDESALSPGPWLLYDDRRHGSIRPLLWTVKGDADAPGAGNALQRAIGNPDPGKRDVQLAGCVASMADNPSAPEWTTLAALVRELAVLPMSSLDVLRMFSRSGRCMATLALRPDVDFDGLTARAPEELPFLWETVRLDDWRKAGEHLRAWCVASAGAQAETLHRIILKDRREKLLAACPAISPLLPLILPLEEDRDELAAVRAYFSVEQVRRELFGDDGEMQRMFRRGSDREHWPEDFADHVRRARRRRASRLLPDRPQGFRESVACLPVLLAEHVFHGRHFGDGEFSGQDVFLVRRHAAFDAEWFETAFTRTLFACMAEGEKE